MGPGMEAFAMQAGQQAMGGIMGIALGGINNKRQLKQQKKLMQLEIAGQKQMTDYNMMKQLQMWKDTNYGAQMEQLRQSGLNPGLIYGMSGGGGVTTGQASGNVTGGHAATGGGEAIAMAQTAATLGLMKAQRENIEADTQNKRATTPQIQETTKSITQGIENTKAQKELLDIQIGIQSVQEHISKMTQNAAVAKILSELRYTTAQMHIWERNNNIDAQTADEKVKLFEQQVIESGARILLTKAQTGQTIEQTNYIAKELALAYDQLKNEQNRTAVQQRLATFETSFGKQASNILQSLLGLRK